MLGVLLFVDIVIGSLVVCISFGFAGFGLGRVAASCLRLMLLLLFWWWIWFLCDGFLCLGLIWWVSGFGWFCGLLCFWCFSLCFVLWFAVVSWVRVCCGLICLAVGALRVVWFCGLVVLVWCLVVLWFGFEFGVLVAIGLVGLLY